jgi:DNA polymerase-3 subunit alpha
MLLMEKEVLGFYLSSHPLEEHRRTLQTYCSHSTSDLAGLSDRTEVMLGGMISAIKTAHVRNPRPGNTATKYVNFDLEDMAGTIRCILWPEPYTQYGEMVKPEAILVARGSIDRRGGGDEANLIVSELIPLDQLDARYTRGVMVRVDEQRHDARCLQQLREIVRGYPGGCELQLLLCLADGSRVVLKSAEMRVEVHPEMRARLDDLLGPGNVQLLTEARRNGNGRASGRTARVDAG